MTDSYETTPGSDDREPTSEDDLDSSIKQDRAYGHLQIKDLKDKVQAVGYTKVWAVLTTGDIEEGTLVAVTPDQVKDVTINGKPMMNWWRNDSDVHQNDRVVKVKLPNLAVYKFPESKVVLQ